MHGLHCCFLETFSQNSWVFLWNSDLYILYCSYPDGCLLKRTAAGGFRTFTWANKRANSSQTWSWPRGLGVLGFFSLQLPLKCGFPRLGGTLECHHCCCKVGAGPQGQAGIWSAKLLSIFCPVCVSWRKGTGQTAWTCNRNSSLGLFLFS